MKKYISILLIFCSVNVFAQTKIKGKIDENDLRQGEWVYEYETHPLIPSGGKTIVRSNYINDTLNGKYFVFSKDSIYKYYLNTVNNELKGFGYLVERGNVRKTFYYSNSKECLVTEFDNNSRLFRTYESKDNKMDGIYMAFDKGKIIMKQYLKMDSLISEEINVFKKYSK